MASQIKPVLLIVGDSFMCPDPAFPGQHWSEMIPEYEIRNAAQPGASNGIIGYNFLQALEYQPDAVVLGFSEPNRLEFKFGSTWITSSNQVHASAEQKLTGDLYRLHVPHEMMLIKDCSLAASLLWQLEHRRIPYAWNMNLLFNNLSKLPFPSDPWVKKILGVFFYRMTDCNLATYQGWKASPGFHVDDQEWQAIFAQECSRILSSSEFL